MVGAGPHQEPVPLSTLMHESKAINSRLLVGTIGKEAENEIKQMRSLAVVAGFVALFVVLWDAFETIVLPRRVTDKFLLTRLFYRSTWLAWCALSHLFPGRKQRELFVSVYGPLSLIFLLIVWASGLIAGFALLHWADGSAFQTADGRVSLTTDLYLSGSTFFSLGLGGVAPQSAFARALVVVEAGIGFGFLAMMISYLPVIYQAFSRREVTISLLDRGLVRLPRLRNCCAG